jgi:hypothetical protein
MGSGSCFELGSILRSEVLAPARQRRSEFGVSRRWHRLASGWPLEAASGTLERGVVVIWPPCETRHALKSGRGLRSKTIALPLQNGLPVKPNPWSVHGYSVGSIWSLAPVAQWIERRPPEPKVAGSNPVRRAKQHRALDT